MSISFDIRSRAKDPLKLFPLFGLYMKKSLRTSFVLTKENDQKKLPKIDIVVPTVSKDHALLDAFIQSIRANVAHPIGTIHIISQPNEEVMVFCRKNDLSFVDEDTVLGYGKNAIDYSVRGIDRSGWLFQQLLKLGADSFVSMDNYLVVDSDTMLLNKHSFIKDGVFTLFQSTEWHRPYFNMFKKLFGQRATGTLSFVSHMMIFNKRILREMKDAIEKINGKAWDQAIISLIDTNELSAFSEYETYGNYLLQYHPHKIALMPFYNTSLDRNLLRPLLELEKKYAKKYNSVSFHSYKK